MEAKEPSQSYLMTCGGQFMRGAKDIACYYIYSYEHLDDLSFMRATDDVLSDLDDGGADIISAVKDKLSSSGWRGDGFLQIFWLPPFVTESTDSHGTYIFHVKQSLNGTSWIAAPLELPWGRLTPTI